MFSRRSDQWASHLAMLAFFMGREHEHEFTDSFVLSLLQIAEHCLHATPAIAEFYRALSQSTKKAWTMTSRSTRRTTCTASGAAVASAARAPPSTS
mmetsp:Transcript_75359/g.212261  ORF Transcript_75359/g.212261 Transcript_75359/m.212261 type:complete len:96 (-) Transcript_75359:350-637(-)